MGVAPIFSRMALAARFCIPCPGEQTLGQQAMEDGYQRTESPYCGLGCLRPEIRMMV